MTPSLYPAGTSRQSRGRACRVASTRRVALRATFPVFARFRGPSYNSLRALRPLRSNRYDESDHEALRAATKPSKHRRLATMRHGPPNPAFAETNERAWCSRRRPQAGHCSEVVAKRRPPQCEPLTGTACRDARSPPNNATPVATKPQTPLSNLGVKSRVDRIWAGGQELPGRPFSHFRSARVAKLVDAPGLGPDASNGVGVRVPPRAPEHV